jgi:hypothetical protein
VYSTYSNNNLFTSGNTLFSSSKNNLFQKVVIVAKTCSVVASPCSAVRACVHLRTGGWSLLIDEWLTMWCGPNLGQYCRCRLRLGLRWCRWRTSTKGLCLCGLQSAERQVSLVRETRWPTGSSAGRMVARRAKRSREQGDSIGSG